MNKDQVKGTAEKVKGKVNEAVGNATDDPAQKAKGQVQQGVGEAQKQYGGRREEEQALIRVGIDRENAGAAGVFNRKSGVDIPPRM
jgi:uncharacterized protein YjbJ (UPF0337 family)